ncbi:MerC domain-containing protein [Bdellovibrio sp. BCCA]|uniref:MerC domain-containing protein n=1 Tax=Bdellovibrio sp. BCCA TaxID=3136281 RepID=UPI0030F194F0
MDERILSEPSAPAKVETHCCDVDHSAHETFEAQTDRWDKLGIFLSSLCAIHCLATPLLVLALPVLGDFFHQGWVHISMAIFVIPVGIFAFWSGYKHHRQTKVFALGVLGLLMVGGASVAPHSWVEFFEYDIVTIFGGLFLVTAHVLNRRACLCHAH